MAYIEYRESAIESMEKNNKNRSRKLSPNARPSPALSGRQLKSGEDLETSPLPKTGLRKFLAQLHAMDMLCPTNIELNSTTRSFSYTFFHAPTHSTLDIFAAHINTAFFYSVCRILFELHII